MESSYTLGTTFYRSSCIMEKEQHKIEEIVASKRKWEKLENMTGKLIFLIK